MYTNGPTTVDVEQVLRGSMDILGDNCRMGRTDGRNGLKGRFALKNTQIKQYEVNLNRFVVLKYALHFTNSVSTIFCLVLIVASARKVFLFGLLTRQKSGGRVRRQRKEHNSNLDSKQRWSSKNCRPSTSLADGSICSKRKLVDTLYYVYTRKLGIGNIDCSFSIYKKLTYIITN